jgi:hypothetical protein
METEGFDLDAGEEVIVQSTATLEHMFPNVALKKLRSDCSIDVPFYVGQKGW